MAKRKELLIEGKKVKIEVKDGVEWFSLTDIANNFGTGRPTDKLRGWLKKKDTLDFLEEYERAFNPDFKHDQMIVFKKEAQENRNFFSIEDYVNATDAKFIRTKRGRYGGTFANFDITSEFMMWISAIFKVWLIRDYRRMKEAELSKSLTEKSVMHGWLLQKIEDNALENNRLAQDLQKLILPPKEKDKSK